MGPLYQKKKKKVSHLNYPICQSQHIKAKMKFCVSVLYISDTLNTRGYVQEIPHFANSVYKYTHF